ncbi:MAG TPA: signal peptidase II [Lachnoclostridium phocaeense]|uniref:Lipoprotein signal peptidase n=1 Tax=Lachnoclostridium phocaeense TaxID=1871021 RepID=A0A921I2M6_9FIRM|nr:signal peptidase II [Lachnoclostridium phocaeense]
MTSVSEKTAKHYITAFIIALADVILDQLSKYMAVHFLQGTDGIDLIPGVFRLTYLENRGAAFGVLQGQQWFFYIITAVILVVVVLAYVRIPAGRKFLPLQICAVFIVSGALGNLIDRVRLGYVVDFFYFELIDFPVFNVADIFVTVSAVLLAVLLLLYYKEEDLEQIFHSGK